MLVIIATRSPYADEDLGLRVEIFAILNIRDVFYKLKHIVFSPYKHTKNLLSNKLTTKFALIIYR